MPTQTVDIDSDLFGRVLEGRWRRLYANGQDRGGSTFVFEREPGGDEVFVLKSVRPCPEASTVHVPGIGPMFLFNYLADPTLAGLRRFLRPYRDVRVVRYRPGKRVVLAAHHQNYGDVIIKTVARGVADIAESMRYVWERRADLDFIVARPLTWCQVTKTVVQQRLPGEPLSLETPAFDRDLVSRMAAAVESLHASGIIFRHRFCGEEQQRRSLRYAGIIGRCIPASRIPVNAVLVRLHKLARTLETDPRMLRPLHGSMHSKQWLTDGDKLALVDFDRASMGHRELDSATLLAEFDYEPSSFGPAFNRAFLAGCADLNPKTLLYYRIHKHLAKAFKASKSPVPDVARAKTLRNLGRALALSSHIEGDSL